MTEKKIQARDLYFNSGKTQREIAEIVGVSERTIYNWVRTQNWQQIREESYHMPATIADKLCRQIVEIQEAIEAREPGNRFPTAQEAEIQRKLICSLDKLKKYPTIGMYRQMFSNYFDSIRNRRDKFKWEVRFSMDKFLEGEVNKGFAPYDTEYYATQTPPAQGIPKNAFEDEEDDEDDDDEDIDIDRNSKPHQPQQSEDLEDEEDDDDDDDLPHGPAEKMSEKEMDETLVYLDQLVENQRNTRLLLSIPQPEKTGNKPATPTKQIPPPTKHGKLIKRY